MIDSDASVRLAAGGALLEQKAYGQGYQQPEREAEQQGGDKAEPVRGPFGTTSRLLHSVSIAALAVGMTTAQLAWLAILAYGAYWGWDRLPL